MCVCVDQVFALRQAVEKDLGEPKQLGFKVVCPVIHKGKIITSLYKVRGAQVTGGDAI